MSSQEFKLSFRIYHGGRFEHRKGKTEYVGGGVNLQLQVSSGDVNVKWLSDLVGTLLGTKKFQIWYCYPGKSLTTGKMLLASEDDISIALRSRDLHQIVSLYAIETITESAPLSKMLVPLPPRTKRPNKSLLVADPIIYGAIPIVSPSSVPKVAGPKLSSPKKVKANGPKKTHDSFFLRKSPRKSLPNCLLSSQSATSQPLYSSPAESTEPLQADFSHALIISEPVTSQPFITSENKKLSIRRGIRFENGLSVENDTNEKGKDKLNENNDDGDNSEDFDFVPSDFSESDLSDFTESENGVSEEEIFVDEEEFVPSENLSEGDFLPKQPTIWGVDNLTIRVREDLDEDSDELESLQGSDDEVDPYPTFNPHTDFSRPIVLRLGLKFANKKIFMKALTHHGIENGYDFWPMHNSSSRVSIYCVKKCSGCEWKKSRLVGKCKCVPKKGEKLIKCGFKVHGTKLEGKETFQIKSMELTHNGCGRARNNRKVTSEYLAERFLEFFRINIDWKVKNFQEYFLQQLNVHVSYKKCWVARARAKMLIYGSGEEQYARVWDYVAAIRKYNTGSTALVVCDNIDRPPVYFKRMYICLQGCKEGFKNGCRPIVGVDGCHLKGAYPGMCLVAVSKDGNNNIFPVAWAVAEVENMATWRWFLELLIGDIGKDEGEGEGEGMTFMSDRQKGLIDALKTVVPKAEIRYCVRHIWANFKLQFSGEAYKETFWAAARATTKADFVKEMEGLRFLSLGAYAYLSAIPPMYWSRHAFSTHSKCDLLLNNICETFNSVLKEARDKPILTQMEWMRKYVMKRICEKREGVHKYKGDLMPYVNKYLTTAIDESRFCILIPSSVDTYEVEYKGESLAVNVKEKTCTCYKWELRGLPCLHAVACIRDLKLNPEDFIDHAYSKEKYMLAYEPIICPMPGVNQWDKVDLPEPLLPKTRKMPGRPSLKKRKKEAGEEKGKGLKRIKKQHKCGNCKQLGHSKRTCQNAPQQPSETHIETGRPLKNTAWAKQERDKTAVMKAAKEAAKEATMASTSACTSATPTPTLMQSQPNVVAPEWARQ